MHQHLLPDEDYINRSLLDRIDAEADTEPVSSSDSEAAVTSNPGSGVGVHAGLVGAGHGYGSASSQSSVESPEFPYRYPMQHPQQGISLQQQGPNRSDSPPHHQQHPFVAHAQAEQFAQAQMQSMFGASNAGPEYASYGDGDNQTAFDSGVFRHGGGSFNYFQNRPRQSAVGMNSSFMNDGSGSSFPGYGMTAADVFGTHQSMQSLTQQQQPNDMRGYDLVGGPQKVANKPIFTNLDPFGTNGLNANIIQPHQNSKISPTHQQSHQQQQIYSGQSSYLNGVLHGQAHSQTPFGPHLTTNGVGAGLVHTNGNSGTIGVSTSQQEEISTIFVVGFPDDMQVCNSGFSFVLIFVEAIYLSNPIFSFFCRNASFRTCLLSHRGSRPQH